MHYSAFLAAFLAVVVLPASVSAHGYLSSPPPRGAEKIAYNIDALKSPNTSGKLCRGEPAGTVTPVKPGQALTLGLTITAPHIGPCRVTLLDENLGNEVPVAEKFNCAAPGGPGSWTITLPTGVQGRKVLRWYWEGQHVSVANPEPYEQCVDLDFGGGSSRPSSAAPPAKNVEDVATPRATSPRNGNQLDAVNEPTNEPKATLPRGEPSVNAASTPDDDVVDFDFTHTGVAFHDADAATACSGSAYRCSASNGGFQQCDHSVWVNMKCADGTRCRADSATTIVCDRA